MRVVEFRELRKGLYDLVRTLTAGSDDHDVCFGLFGDSMLKHGLTGTKRTRDKACTTLAQRVRRVDRTHTGLEQFERPRFLAVRQDGFLHRPFLNHRHFVIHTFCIGQNRHHFVNGVLTGFGDGLHGVGSFEYERYHDLVRLMVFIHFAEPSSSLYFIANFGDRSKGPFLLLVEREVVLTALEEHTRQFIEVVLQTVVVTT